MRALFVLDLITLLPLFLVGGANTLWWMLITAAIGGLGLLLSFGSLRDALTAARQGKIGFSLPGLGMVALAAFMLMLPGLLSDFIGLIAAIACLKLLFAVRDNRNRRKDEPPEQAYKRHAEHKPRHKRRIIDVSYNEVKDKEG